MRRRTARGGNLAKALWRRANPRLPLAAAVLGLAVALPGVLGLTAGASRAADRPFVHRLSGEPLSLDPAKSNSLQDDQVMWLLYDALQDGACAGRAVGAEAWRSADAGFP